MKMVGKWPMADCYFKPCGAGRNGQAAPVLAGPVFLKVKIKFNFFKKKVINKSTSVIFGLVRLVILS